MSQLVLHVEEQVADGHFGIGWFLVLSQMVELALGLQSVSGQMVVDWECVVELLQLLRSTIGLVGFAVVVALH